jgi:hypothetical protein
MSGSDNLRCKIASLREEIGQALEKHPELRDVTDQIALRQDLHVEVGAPFLERTYCKLQERARAIIDRRPDLGHYFRNEILVEAVDDPLEGKLIAALKAHVSLRVEAERLIAAYVARESNKDTIISELIALFDGPGQREAQALSAEAMGECWRKHRS